MGRLFNLKIKIMDDDDIQLNFQVKSYVKKPVEEIKEKINPKKRNHSQVLKRNLKYSIPNSYRLLNQKLKLSLNL